MTRRAQRDEGPDLFAIARKRDGRAKQLSPLGVIGVRVSKHDPLDAALRNSPPHGIEVSAKSRPRIHHPTPDHIGVRPVQRQW